MTQDKARKRAARERAAATGERYTRAARAVHDRTRFAMPPEITPPDRWPDYSKWGVFADQRRAVVVVDRNPDGDRIEVVDDETGHVLAAVSVPHVPGERLLAEYTAEGLFPPRQALPGALITTAERTEISLGRPDLAVYRLGYETLGHFHWHQWADGTWRTPAYPARTAYTATVSPVPDARGRLRMVVERHPGGRVSAEATLTAFEVKEHWQTVGGDPALDGALDSIGYTVRSGLWYRLPGGSFYAACRPGRLAERDWWTLARVRIVRETTVGAVDPRVHRTFRVGEELTMNQWGSAGREIDRDAWWTSTDIDGAHIIQADRAEVIEVLEEHPPTWAAAALTAEQVVRLLAPHHQGAAQAAAAWLTAGLHVAHEHGGLAIRTPAPELRKVGHVPRDYWDGNRFTKPYEVVVDADRSWTNRKLDALPLDPVAVAGGAR